MHDCNLGVFCSVTKMQVLCDGGTANSSDATIRLGHIECIAVQTLAPGLVYITPGQVQPMFEQLEQQTADAR